MIERFRAKGEATTPLSGALLISPWMSTYDEAKAYGHTELKDGRWSYFEIQKRFYPG